MLVSRSSKHHPLFTTSLKHIPELLKSPISEQYGPAFRTADSVTDLFLLLTFRRSLATLSARVTG